MRDIKLLTPECQELHANFAFVMAKNGLNYMVTSTLRTWAEQQALWAQGREPVEVVNALRKAVGWAAIGAVEAAKKVTWTMESQHLKGTAFDIALIDRLKKPHWNEKISVNNNALPDYKEAAEIGRSVGLKPGYDFSDPCHFEVPV
jgi:hypothetical protein